MRPTQEATPVVLPSGCVHEGRWLRQVWLRAWNGHDAEAVTWEGMSPAARTTTILSRCLTLEGGHPAGDDFVRRLSVGDRDALLLHLQQITYGGKLDCVLTCPSCREKMDLELHVRDLLLRPYEYSQDVHAQTVSAEDGSSHEVRFRLPNGADQEELAQLTTIDAAAAIRELLARCVESIDGLRVGALQEDSILGGIAAGVSARMAELDPQAELLLNATCPACGESCQSVLDVAAIVQQEIERAQTRLYREVHRLASHYHWPEASILALSDAKRRRYLQMVRQEQELQRGGTW